MVMVMVMGLFAPQLQDRNKMNKEKRETKRTSQGAAINAGMHAGMSFMLPFMQGWVLYDQRATKYDRLICQKKKKYDRLIKEANKQTIDKGIIRFVISGEFEKIIYISIFFN
jgi:hypothetical protein